MKIFILRRSLEVSGPDLTKITRNLNVETNEYA